MKNRIIQLLNSEKLSATKFADIIGVQRSSISHIISGRNKPSFDFISKTMEKFPEVNVEWLINGKGSMYKDVNKEGKEDKKERDPEFFKEREIKTIEESMKDDKEDSVNVSVTNVNNIEKVIILLTNGTFKEYSKS